MDQVLAVKGWGRGGDFLHPSSNTSKTCVNCRFIDAVTYVSPLLTLLTTPTRLAAIRTYSLAPSPNYSQHPIVLSPPLLLLSHGLTEVDWGRGPKPKQG